MCGGVGSISPDVDALVQLHQILRNPSLEGSHDSIEYAGHYNLERVNKFWKIASQSLRVKEIGFIAQRAF
jgi:hypothetical protein